jgi:CIC family chloride channel protein
VGVLTRRDLLAAGADPAAPLRALLTRVPVTVRQDASLRDAVEAMLGADVGRLPVLDADGRLAGILTRSDVLSAHRRRMDDRRRPGERAPAA